MSARPNSEAVTAPMPRFDPEAAIAQVEKDEADADALEERFNADPAAFPKHAVTPLVLYLNAKGHAEETAGFLFHAEEAVREARTALLTAMRDEPKEPGR